MGLLARWEAELSSGQELLLVTQNVDELRQRAGSKNVVELHGNILFTKCSNIACDLERYRDEAPHRGKVPRCPKCRAVLRPDVVLFGEEIPALPAWSVKRALRDCDLFVAIGNFRPCSAGGQLRSRRGVRWSENDSGEP